MVTEPDAPSLSQTVLDSEEFKEVQKLHDSLMAAMGEHERTVVEAWCRQAWPSQPALLQCKDETPRQCASCIFAQGMCTATGVLSLQSSSTQYIAHVGCIPAPA